ncbi:Patatin-like phospholipase [Bordetella ansorpii]|uniref:Patatin-like phospholipase n=1 Tax=Bordetella ansorpii TaxID=288768 RepID=A0A157S944_9BORD|nr:patatin-like phospholipase family protein [Bordetella ansorpii]SAI66915.1 Patatin-like phospholipase [Bordetella ansorpii]
MVTAPLGNVGHLSAQWNDAVQRSGETPKGFARLAGIFSTPTSSATQLVNTREAFKGFFQAQVSQLGAGVPGHSKAGFEVRAQELCASILENSLDTAMQEAIARGDGRVPDKVLREAVSKANARAQEALQELQIHASHARLTVDRQVDIRPQVVPRFGPGQEVVGFNVIRQAPQIENLVFRGGGAKGIGNPEALVEMQGAGMLSGLKHLVGTSAGALTAVCLSCGQDAHAFQEFSASVDMNELKGKPEDFETRYPMVNVSWRTGFHAGRALELLDQTSASGVSQHLNKHWDPAAMRDKLASLGGEQEIDSAIERLDQLRTQDFDDDRTGQMVTFKDLHLMHLLAPAQFKELTLTGWDNTNKRETYFNAQNTPDMPVAVAGRISMSIPVYFRSVDFDPGDGSGTRSFTDGGVGSNMPTEVITDGLQGRALEEARARTALMTFDENGKAYTVLHQEPEGPATGFGAWAKAKASGNAQLSETGHQDRTKIHEAGSNAFVIFHGDIGTFDLDASPERVRKAQTLSTLKTLEQIEQRRDQAYATEFDSAQDCFAVLTDHEKQALRDGGEPHPGNYPPHYETDPIYRFEFELYELAHNAAG